jgi:hypothetical protein
VFSTRIMKLADAPSFFKSLLSPPKLLFTILHITIFYASGRSRTYHQRGYSHGVSPSRNTYAVCSQLCLATLTHSSYTETGAHHHRPSPHQYLNEVQRGSNTIDGSWPLFNMYLAMAREEDKTMAESWKADADGILIFVSHLYTITAFNVDSDICRRACSLLPLRRCSRCQSRTSGPGKARKVPKCSISRAPITATSSSLSESIVGHMSPILPRYPNYPPRPLRQGTPSWSTHSGS